MFSANGETVTSKVSSSRSKIVVSNRDATGKTLKTGMTCDIVYVPGGNNEPKTIACQ